MIMPRLKILLAEKNLTISQVANDTKISRTTLTALANNTLKGIRLDTINTLCQYLDISIKDFFDFLPFDFNVSLECLRSYRHEVNLNVIKKSNSRILGVNEKRFSLVGRIEEFNDIFNFEGNISTKVVEVLLGDTLNKEVFESQIKDFNSFLNELKGNFKELFFQQVRERIEEAISEDTLNLKSNDSLCNFKFKFTFDNAFLENETLPF